MSLRERISEADTLFELKWTKNTGYGSRTNGSLLDILGAPHVEEYHRSIIKVLAEEQRK